MNKPQVVMGNGDPNTVTVVTKCNVCGGSSELVVPREGYFRWINGELIQRALPDVHKDIREQLISGTHAACWDLLYRTGEDRAHVIADIIEGV